MRWVSLLLAALGLCAPIGCGGDKSGAKSAAEAGGLDLDGDPLVLLPSSPVVLAQVDAKAFYRSDGAGAKLAKIAERYCPLGDESGFVASRDLEKIVVGAYSMSGGDVAAIVRGKFDEPKIAGAARSQTMTRIGAPITESKYAGRTLYTVRNIGFTVLTPKTVLAGTESGIRRTLERIQDKRTTRDVPPWMAETIATDGAALSFAVDLATQPVANAAVGSVPLDFLKGMRTARFVGNFKDPGMHFAATLTFGDAQQASASADQIRAADGWTRALGAFFSFVPQLQGLDVNAADRDVTCKAAVDDHALGKLVEMFPGLGAGP